MTTRQYSELLAQVEALAGATLATQEQARVKIFANRRARAAHRECDYWPHLLHVGEERIVSDTGLLPLEQTGLTTIDKIIRIHAEDPFKSESVFEYCEYYQSSDGIQITGYSPAEASTGANMVVTGALNPDVGGTYAPTSIVTSSEGLEFDQYTSTSNNNYTITLTLANDPSNLKVFYYLGNISSGDYFVADGIGLDGYFSTPADASGLFVTAGAATGSPIITAEAVYSAFVTYLAGIPTNYGDGESEESDIPEAWFEYMAQGAYTDWLRSDGSTEKAMAEEAIAAGLLNQQLEKVSRSNGQQVITRVMTHANRQAR